MTGERWRQVEALYRSARERGVAALEGAEPELRREVERLLAEDTGTLLAEHGGRDTAGGLSGRTVGQYEILETLGAGGMGVVYKARDTRLNRLVALKFLPPHLRDDPGFKRRLMSEARAASALDHPHIVVVHDIGEGDELFVAMAYHEGVTLRQRIAEGMSVSEALDIARQIALGLAKAHEHGILHRDIKPGNVIVAKDGIARIIDFGLARTSDATVTQGAITGTPMYMSPEQATGAIIDHRTDLWSLGVVLYEMLSGEAAYQGDSHVQVLRAIADGDPPRLRAARPEVPARVDAIVARALQKDPLARYQSAAKMAEDLVEAIREQEGRAPRPTSRRAVIAAVAAVLAVAAGGAWLYQRSEKRHWAREQAMPEIARLLKEARPVAASRLLREAERYLPGDTALSELAKQVEHPVRIESTPPGASVEVQDYRSPDDAWLPLGVTPVQTKIPSGYLRWRVKKTGLPEFIGAPVVDGMFGYFPEMRFSLEGSAPDGMVAVPATKYEDYVWSLGQLGPYNLPAYSIDRFEVTNRQYQAFVDADGYGRREYWKEKFVEGGRELSWEQAMERFRDTSGRAGPASWTAGRFPAGQEEYPVGGVSWYEASAYAEWAGKSLPTISQWFHAAPGPVAKHVVPVSNFSDGPAPVGKSRGVGPFGTYDMAGNVTEWTRNESALGLRYSLGGGWKTPTAEYHEPGSASPFYRGANSGFRCVKNTAPLAPEVVAPRPQNQRDFAKAKPATDEVFRSYRAMYEYDRTPLNAKVEGVAREAHWTKEKISFDAAYGKERLTAYLFVPDGVRPPYQTVVFFPSARVLNIPSSDRLGDLQCIDYVIQSGRAVLYPVYKGTYERSTGVLPSIDTVAAREVMIQDYKDLGRSVDYLETRQDIHRERIGYLGVSMGAGLGTIYAALEHRFRAVIFFDGGFPSETPLAGTDAADFAPRIQAPTLMLAGSYDFVFMGKGALLRLLGTPPADKRLAYLPTAHDVSEKRDEMVRETLAWLDRYLGRVN
jgi:formylglycine-generating enzyme required for sulfatase activity/dienelactone hydrolase/tRNA A-37 threonylcarbamoyl transferase component Bud32